jgi:hypothetical protein
VKRITGSLAVLAVSAAVCSAAAFAGNGGQAPSSAPDLAVGQHVFSSCEGLNYELWGVPNLLHGDRVTLAWATGSATMQMVAPADDFNWASRDTNSGEVQFGAARERIRFPVWTSNGRYFLKINCARSDAAFDIVIESIKHGGAVDVVPAPKKLGLSGRINASFVRADGAAVSEPGLPFRLVTSYGGAQHVLAQGTPVNGQLSFAYRLPVSVKGRRLVFTVSAAETDAYQPFSTRFAATIR